MIGIPSPESGIARRARSWFRGHAITRRQLIGRAGQAALFSVVPSRALGLGGATPPSARIGMGFIGLGGQGTGHLLGGAWTYVPGGYAAREDVEVIAVCDVRKERREAARDRCNQIRAQRPGARSQDTVAAYNDFREVLARPDIDAVLLALPYHWAGRMAALAARAGKDVYCEKPVCITVREGRRLAETVRRYGRIYQAGTQQRSEYGGKFRLARDIVRSGRIGKLREIFAYRQPGAFRPFGVPLGEIKPLPDGFDWDLWLGPLPEQPYCGSAGHALPGCFVGDVNWAPHHYDFIQWVLDAANNGPVEIEWERGTPPSSGGTEPATGGQGGAEFGNIHYHYPGGIVVHSTPCPDEDTGSVGGACFVGTEGRIAVDRNAIITHPPGILRDAIASDHARSSRPQGHADNFIDGIKTRRPTICEAETAHRSMSSVLVGGIAIALRRNLRWDPAAEQFPGDHEANRLLSYAPRPPWGA